MSRFSSLLRRYTEKDVSAGEKVNLRQALRQEAYHRIVGHNDAVIVKSATKKVKQQKQVMRGFVPQPVYNQQFQEKAVRSQFGKPTNDREPASSKILSGGSEFFRRDEYQERYL